jgi:hypothetical protein
MPSLTDLPEKIQGRIEVAPNGCWLWIGSRTALGYGQIELVDGGKRKAHLAHRLVYSLLVGDPGENLHHHAHDDGCPKHCVRPEHLTPLTIAEHATLHATKEQCIHGHDLADAYVRPDGTGRICRRCRADREKERYARMKNAAGRAA